MRSGAVRKVQIRRIFVIASGYFLIFWKIAFSKLENNYSGFGNALHSVKILQNKAGVVFRGPAHTPLPREEEVIAALHVYHHAGVGGEI